MKQVLMMVLNFIGFATLGAADIQPLPQGMPPMALPTIDVSFITKKYLDIAYDTTSKAQVLDIYLPEELAASYPVIIAIHGGAFMVGDKSDIQLKAPLEGLKRGYAVVSINYRLSGEAIFPAQINDVTNAIMFLKKNAHKYKLDSKKIALWGGSAGGNLVALAGTLCASQEFLSETTCKVQAVVDWFGPINFLTMDEQFRKSGKGEPSHSASTSPESNYLGATITHIPTIVKQASPETYISPKTPPFFVQHGDQDPLVPLEQSIEFVQKLKNAIGEKQVSFEVLNGAGHGGQAFENRENLEKIFTFLDAHLKN